MNTSITLEYLSSHLELRKKRLISKSEKLGLILKDQSELSKVQVLLLLRSYIESKQTSESTKAKAILLLKTIDRKEEVTMETKTLVVPEEKAINRTIRRGEVRRKWYLNFGHQLYHCVQTLFDECVQLLTSYRFKFLALFIAISVQINHSAALFYRTAPEGSSYTWTAYGYAIMVDFFIVIIALERKKSIAKVFAVLTFLTNLLYFRVWIDFDGTSEAYTNAVASLIIAATISYTIYAYTEIFVQKEKQSI